ncbi:MAG: metallophosphoesterase family protein [Oscillospiraceae bacterium]|nr:metallophosphoesterase family protein [Oscillospiraceae bacterium]
MTRKVSALLLALALLLGCLGLGVQAAGSSEVTRVVSTYYGKDAQGFHWYTAGNSGSKVVINGETYTGSSVKFQGSYAHSAVAAGLSPGTTYTYQIGDYTGTFKTDPGRGKPVSFIVTGDVQASDEEGFAYSSKTVGAAWEAFPSSAFTVTLGDMTNNCDNAQWDMYFDSFKGTFQKAAFVPVAGNHDGNGKWNWFRNMFTLKEECNISNLTGVYYSFDYGDAHIAVLNSNDVSMSTQQRNWLINDMSQTDAQWKLVFMHKAPYSAGAGSTKLHVLLLRNALIPLFDDLGVDLVMTGHDHQYYRSEPSKGDKPVGAESQTGTSYTDPKGTVYILPGAACDKRYGLKPYEDLLPAIKECAAKHEEPGKPIYAHLAIHGGMLTYKAYTLDTDTGESEEYDTLELKKSDCLVPPTNYKPLRTDPITTFPRNVVTFIYELLRMILCDYLPLPNKSWAW